MRILDQDILSIRIEDIEEVTGAPIITHNLSIFSDLSFKIQINCTINSSSIVKDITASPEDFSTVAEVLNVLASIKSHNPNCLDNLKMAAMILEKVAEEVASFAAEQIKLVTEPRNGRR